MDGGDAPQGRIRAVLANPGLRRIEIAWTLGIAGDAAFTVALLVAAYTIGGPVAIGILTIVRMAPSVVGAPLAGLLAARRPPTEVLFIAHATRALGAIAVTALLAANGPVLLGLLAATVAASAGAFVRPLQVAATPAFATTPGELVAANGATSTGEGLGSFVGPLIGGLLVAVGGATAAAAAAAILFLGAAVALARLELSADDRAHRAAGRAGGPTPPAVSAATIGRELSAGLRVLARRRAAATVIGGFASQIFVRGLLTTLTVVAAIRLLSLGEPGVGILGAAFGLGTLGGAILSIRLPRGRLAPVFAVSLAMWGLPLVAIAAVPHPAVAVGALVVSGIANATLDVSGFTLLQRGVSGGERTPVFGVLEAVVSLGLVVGGAVAPVLIDVLGDRGALAAAGAILPIVAVVSWTRLRAADAEVVLPERELALLQGIPLFARLPLAALEQIAESMHLRPVAAGAVLVRAGDPGDEYLIIAAGRFEVRHGSRVLGQAGPGDGVGEIALLRAVPRTATIVAIEDSAVYGVDAGAFLTAVAGPTRSAAAAAIVEARLARSSRYDRSPRRRG